MVQRRLSRKWEKPSQYSAIQQRGSSTINSVSMACVVNGQATEVGQVQRISSKPFSVGMLQEAELLYILEVVASRHSHSALVGRGVVSFSMASLENALQACAKGGLKKRKRKRRSHRSLHFLSRPCRTLLQHWDHFCPLQSLHLGSFL